MEKLQMEFIELILKAMTSGKLLKFLQKEIEVLWDESIPNAEKKDLVIAKAMPLFKTVSEVMISFIIKFIVTSIRMRVSND